ncbi:MAG: endonuclease III [Oligoflexus sp.]|nr:endonuclease III [Oligoflexus sp.]
MVAFGSLSKRKELARVILEKLQKANPNPRCELIYKNPYQLLVSVALSAQTTDRMVNRVMAPLYEGEFTPESVVALGADGFLAKIRSIGLAPTKSKNVVKFSSILLEKYGGEVPNSREALESLPGVGRKTANVILGEIFRHPTLAVDTHVYRVSRRLGLQNEKTPEKAELELLKVVDPRFLPDGHHHFILHGRYVCKALTTLCEMCVLNDICPSYEDLRPKPEEKAAMKAKSKAAKKPLAGKAQSKSQTTAMKVSKQSIRVSDIELPRKPAKKS